MLLGDVPIPPCPQVLIEVLNEIKEAEFSFERFDEIIGRDVALASGTLKVVNSPFLGLRQPIGSIPHAVRLLGVTNVVNVVLGLAMQSSFSDFGGLFMDMFRAHSNRRARVAMLVARACKGVAPDEAYAVGLLCDCGVPLLHSRFEEYPEVFEGGRLLTDRSLSIYENNRLGTTHTSAGHVMATSWKLPEAFCTCILRHHDAVDYYTGEQFGEATALLAVLQLARTVCRRMDGLSDSYEWTQVGGSILGYLGLEEATVDTLAARAYEAERGEAA